MTSHVTELDQEVEGAAEVERPRARRGEGEQLRDELLDAAEDLLIRHGAMDAVSIRAITREVGVTPPSLYLHFEDKDALFFAVCERRFQDFAEQVVGGADVADCDDPVSVLRAMGRAYVRYGVEHAEHYQILFSPTLKSVVAGRDLSGGPGMQSFDALVQVVQWGIDTGAFRDQDARLGAFAVWSSVHGAVMILLAKEGMGEHFELPDPMVLADTVCETVLHGLAA